MDLIMMPMYALDFVTPILRFIASFVGIPLLYDIVMASGIAVCVTGAVVAHKYHIL